MSERYTAWSITINNPTESEVVVNTPGWNLEGQYEVGKEGTRHFQGMLKTPQMRFSSIKKVFPRAHIEPAKNVAALQKYCHKEESRVDVYTPGAVPTIFEYQTTVATAWNECEWKEFSKNVIEDKIDDTAMLYLDILVKRDIEAGKRGCEWIAINPMWRSSWRKFWRSIIKRNEAKVQAEHSSNESSSSTQSGGSGSNDVATNEEELICEPGIGDSEPQV